MKRSLIFITFYVLLSSVCYSQDVILKHDETEIKAKVTEITPDHIRYKDYDFLDGPTRTIRISDVSMIVYESGRREIFHKAEAKPQAEDFPVGYRGNYFTIGFGGGTTYGGLGVRFQFRAGGIVGFGMHGGLGYSPHFIANDPYIKGAVGMKLFPFRDIYLNYQLGVHDNHYLTGTAMLGVDLTWGRTVGIGFNIGGGVTFVDNMVGLDKPLTPAFDLGFLLRF